MDNELVVAIVALVIAVIAFVTTVVQLAQSIIATARGLPNCDRRVMGMWAKSSKLWFKWWQLRLEVDFESPVIFLSSDENDRGPIEGGKIWYANGSMDSFEAFCVEDGAKDALEQQLMRERIHTVDHELATWITLLGAIQKMEKDSRLWEGKQWQGSTTGIPNLQGKVVTLAVGMQIKTRSLDAVPTIKRPYATTTISHLIELAAVLGVYWKEFNRDQNKYRAEGNGYSLLGTRVDDFGLVFVFEKTGWPSFEDTRIIPTYEVKEVCFGNVPSFFREKSRQEHDRAPTPIIEQKSLETLQLGSNQELTDTLSLIGCNTSTILHFQKADPKQVIHLFPITFEIMGMLGRTLHVMERPFRYLPNPTFVPWNARRFNMRRMLCQFQRKLSEWINNAASGQYSVSYELEEISAHASKLQRDLPDKMDSFKPSDLDEIHKAIDFTDKVLLENVRDKNVVLDVMRRHIQQVVLAINTKTASDTAVSPTSPTAQRSLFEVLLRAPPENREELFMEQYFYVIRPHVIGTDPDYEDGPAAQASLRIHTHSPQKKSDTVQNGTAQSGLHKYWQYHDTHPSLSSDSLPTNIDDKGTTVSAPSWNTTILRETNATDSPPTQPRFQSLPDDQLSKLRINSLGLAIGGQQDTGPSLTGRAATWATTMSQQFEPRRHDIWCTLVFRMICWLMLHDFDKRDVQISKSELMGSRLPVYIM